MIDKQKEKAIRSEGSLSITFGQQTNKYIFREWGNGEWHNCEKYAEEIQNAFMQFIQQSATLVYIQESNGRSEYYPISDFMIVPAEGYMEHNSKPLAINLFQPTSFSYSYQYDNKGEITDREPFRNVIIL